MPIESRPLLACPSCGEELLAAAGRRRLGCPQGHGFDAAKQGYFNLLTGAGTKFQADTAGMVQARVDFLGAGHYAPLARALTDLGATAAANPVILDAGAGTGYYLAEVSKALDASETVALDISKYALRRAARALPTGFALVWDVWRPLPLADGAADLVLNVFSPRNPQEFRRVLVPGGALVVVTPLPSHLRELRAVAGLLDIGAGKDEHIAQALGPGFTPEASRRVEYSMDLSRTDTLNAALMGPSAHHLDRASLEHALDSASFPLSVSAAFSVSRFTAV
ncbi:methyltransferase domain-containing protein [Arthrobacter sp. 7Tela_A1]|uniref:methyltransferase domain-containing protein n=1 Tax=Arthrobacter sp. 7Tela_A1 TaxID=3093745 RepID=UPI003BB6E199